MKRLLLMIGLALACASTGARGALLGTYDFTGGDSAVPSAAGMTFGAFTRQNVTAASESGRFASSGWNAGLLIDAGEYVQFTITPTSGTLTFSSLSFHIDSHKANGANDGGPASLQVSIFSTAQIGLGVPLASQTWTGVQDTRQTLTFDPLDQTTASGFTVRIYGWGAENAAGTLSFDDMAVNGSLSAVPEPVNVALLAFGLGMLGVWSGRRWLRRRVRG